MGTNEMDLQELAGLAALDGCTRRELSELDGRVTELRIRAGRTICHQGARAQEVLILLDGFATRTRGGGELAGQVGPGTILGGAEVADGRPHETTVTTRSVARILVLGTADYADLRAVAPGLAGRLAGVVPPTVAGRPEREPRPALLPQMGFLPA